MKETTIGKLNVSVGISVDSDTAWTCLRLIEIYLNNSPDETLIINCDEYGNWDLDFIARAMIKKGGAE